MCAARASCSLAGQPMDGERHRGAHDPRAWLMGRSDAASCPARSAAAFPFLYNPESTSARICTRPVHRGDMARPSIDHTAVKRSLSQRTGSTRVYCTMKTDAAFRMGLFPLVVSRAYVHAVPSGICHHQGARPDSMSSMAVVHSIGDDRYANPNTGRVSKAGPRDRLDSILDYS
jgi:hypothetical protein